MSRSVRNRGGIGISATLVECDPTEMTAGDRIHHIDQLSDADYRAFLDAIDGSAGEIVASDLVAGDVVKYTTYYRIV